MRFNTKTTAAISVSIAIVTMVAFVLLLVKNKQLAVVKAEKLKEQARLLEIVRSDNSAQVRTDAVAGIDAPTILMELASNEKEHAWVRITALRKLTNQAFLAKIAKNDEDGDICVAAFRNLTDQALLLDIATNSVHLGSRAVAASMLNDRALAEELRKQIDKLRQREGRVKAELWRLEEMTDPAVLADWAKNHEYPEVRQAAESRLNELTK